MKVRGKIVLKGSKVILSDVELDCQDIELEYEASYSVKELADVFDLLPKAVDKVCEAGTKLITGQNNIVSLEDIVNELIKYEAETASTEEDTEE